MPEARLARTRRAYLPLAIGSYEWAVECERQRLRGLPPWRAPHQNAAEQLARFHDQQVIEAQLADCEPFDANRDPGDETTT